MKSINQEEITQKQFEAYENIRSSSITNMFNIKKVMKLSTLSREQVETIMENYKDLANKYLI